MSKSIAIIETSAVSSAELKALCREMMPEVTVYEIIDSSLIEEVKANGGPTKAVRSRMFKYYEIAVGLGVDAILNQCSSVSEVAEEAKKLGIEIVAEEAFTADSKTDFSTQLKKAQSAGADLVFMPIYYTEASLILQQASTMGFAPQFFGCDGMDGILQVQNFDTKLAEGLMLLTPFAADATDDLTVKFVESYKAAYNEVPVQFAADAYDAIYAIKAAIEDANVTPDADASTICDALKASMLNIKLDGLTGEGMTWTEDGEPHKAPKAVKVVDGAYSAM